MSDKEELEKIINKGFNTMFRIVHAESLAILTAMHLYMKWFCGKKYHESLDSVWKVVQENQKSLCKDSFENQAEKDC